MCEGFVRNHSCFFHALASATASDECQDCRERETCGHVVEAYLLIRIEVGHMSVPGGTQTETTETETNLHSKYQYAVSKCTSAT